MFTICSNISLDKMDDMAKCHPFYPINEMLEKCVNIVDREIFRKN